MKTLRVRLIEDDEKRARPEWCRECGKATRGKKPYCSDHVTRMPYAVEIQENVERMRKEIEGEIDVSRNGGLCDEVLALALATGIVSSRKAVRTIAVDHGGSDQKTKRRREKAVLDAFDVLVAGGEAVKSYSGRGVARITPTASENDPHPPL